MHERVSAWYQDSTALARARQNQTHKCHALFRYVRLTMSSNPTRVQAFERKEEKSLKVEVNHT
jgi:hypothetical protein